MLTTRARPRSASSELGIAVALVLGAVLLGLVSANPLLTLASVLLPVVLVKLLWRPGEPPALLFAMGYHWIQASILVFYADLGGRPLEQMEYGTMVVPATWLTLLGVLVVAVGMRAGAGTRYAPVAQPSVQAITTQLSVTRLFLATLASIGLSLLVTRLAYFVPGLVQPILALALLRWVMVFLFTYVVLAQRRGYHRLALVFGVEIIIGFLGFFSDFKTVLIVMLLAALTAPSSLRGIRIRTAMLLAGVIVALAVGWTGIKTEYREFLNKGTRQQVVLVPIDERVAKLATLVGGLTPQKLDTSVQKLMERLTYVYYFGQAMQVVPDYVAHERGLLWREAVQSALVPRFLNPGKRVIDDSERTSHYTGARVAGAKEGTSISMGYMAESYIDFGPVMMMLPLLLWGVFVGWVYATLIRSTRYPLFGYGCAAVLVGLGAAVLEQSNLKMVASIVLGFLALYLIQQVAAGPLLRLLALPSRVDAPR